MAEDDFDSEVKLEFRAWYNNSRHVDGTLVIRSTDASDKKKGDINYHVEPEKEVSFDSDHFNDFFQETYNNDLRYITFTDADDLRNAEGTLYFGYGTNSEKSFTRNSLTRYRFYYEDEDDGDYSIDGLSFVAEEDLKDPVTLKFRAWYNDSRYVDGTVVISRNEETASSSGANQDRRYPLLHHLQQRRAAQRQRLCPLLCPAVPRP